MKKNKNVEMRIYELLGVKTFRKMAFALSDKICILFTLKMSKEERKEYLYHTASNYNLGEVKSLEDVKKFKKQLFSNARIHLFGLLVLIPNFIKIIGGTAALSYTIITLIAGGINLYCVMLQRYNCIRINQLIKKMTPRYERQRDEIKEELRKEDSLLLEHTYKIVDKKERETSITFEDLIANANIEQLKQYREYLAYFQSVNQSMQENGFYSAEHQVAVSMPMEKHKTLKLELKPNKHNNGAIN